ncbi:MAG: cupin domain-containing protein [Methylacidiphilaceae bacterium]|nr:cupin domain-containing protein [Candidatus Methylacidiphilaceae bacterium]
MNAEQTRKLLSEETLEKEAVLFEYSQAADPIAAGTTPKIPVKQFLPEDCLPEETGLFPLDLSGSLGTDYPATSPSLLANFARVRRGESLTTSPESTSELYYVIEGSGFTDTEWGGIAWKRGDLFVLPGGKASHRAEEDARFYIVNDSPLLAYLGVARRESRFAPLLFRGEAIRAELEKATADPEAARRSRVSVLLANRRFPQTMTVTHCLWAMFGVILPGTRQKPHRHQSVALDFVVEGRPGVFTRVGRELEVDGSIRAAARIDWVTSSAFVTPPGYWHEHGNDSDGPAYVLPIQDAGLHTYLRTLDIRFT